MQPRALILLFTLLAAPASAQVVTSDPLLELIQNAQLSEQLAQGATLTSQLAQIQALVSNAKDQVALARDVYAGLSSFQHFNPDEFLAQGSAYFASQVPGLSVATDAAGLVTDVTTHGLQGGRFTGNISARFDVYGDAARRSAAAAEAGAPPAFAPARALGLSADFLAALQSDSSRQRLLLESPPTSIIDGLLLEDLERVDPSLLRAYVRSRAQASDAEDKALKLLAEAFDKVAPPSPGKAAQLTAQSTAQSTVELTRINAALQQQLAYQQLQRAEESEAAARARQQTDAVWDSVGRAVDHAFNATEPLPDFPSTPLR